MTIAVDIRDWQPGCRTGIGRLLEVFLEKAMAVRAQDRFLLLGNATCEIRVQGSNSVVIRAPEYWTLLWDQVVLPIMLHREGASVLYSPYPKVPLFASIPVVSTIHDLTFFVFHQYNRRLRHRIVNWVFKVFCKCVLQKAAAVFVDSKTTAKDVQEIFGHGEQKLHECALAVSSRYSPKSDVPRDPAVLARYGLAPGYVLYVGNFSPHKNIRVLIRAHQAMSKSLRQSHPLVLAGMTKGADPDLSLDDFHPDSHVRCLGLVPEEDLPALYRMANLFAFPSFYEGFGLPVLEAMSSGTPVLCSTAPALLELTQSAARHVEPTDTEAWQRALEQLLTHPVECQDLRDAGLARATNYSVQRMTSQILNVLDHVVCNNESKK